MPKYQFTVFVEDQEKPILYIAPYENIYGAAEAASMIANKGYTILASNTTALHYGAVVIKRVQVEEISIETADSEEGQVGTE